MKLNVTRRFAAFLLTVSLTFTLLVMPAAADGVSLTLNVLEKQMSVGDTVELKVTLTPEDATDVLTWRVAESTFEGVISLDDNGKECVVTAQKPGTAKVTVAIEGGASAECEITVSGIALDADKMKMTVGATKSLTLLPYGVAETLGSAVWSSSNPSVAEVINGKITAYYPGTATISASVGSYKASCTVTVEEDVADAIEVSAKAGQAISFADLRSDLNSCSRTKVDDSLSYISGLQVSPSQGVLYYGYLSSDNPGNGVGSEAYYASPSTGQLGLNNISFVPNTDFSGTAVIYYTGRGNNGRSFNGTIRVSVSVVNDVYYSTSADQPVYFEAKDFSAVCNDRTGKELISVSFVPPSSGKGVLYYNYSAGNIYNPEVSSSVSLYRTKAPYLDDVVFVPNTDYEGSVEITYYCTTSSGTHTGKVKIQVSASSQVNAGKISYNVASGGHVDLDVDDFNQMCRELTGSSLNYVRFDPPSTGYGTLYYNYSSSSDYGSVVSSSRRYFRSSTPRIANITFVASGSFSGDVSVPFTGYSIDDESFSGEVVFRAKAYDGTIFYQSTYGESIYFDGADFNELCQSLNGRSLNYVCFEPPASTCGTLYRSTNYSSSTKVKSTTKFYRSGGSYQIDDVVFVPNSTYTGTFEIPFSGYDTSNGRISGLVQITVARKSGSVTVSYQTNNSGSVNFDEADFDLACQLRTGERLRYVQFTLPSSSRGKLYYNYDASSDSGTAVSASTKYYRSSANRLLDNVTFRAADGYVGTVTISYTGVSVSDTQYSGTVEITVSRAAGALVSYTGSSLPITLKAADFTAACTQQTGRKLSYLRFTQLPSETAGKLYSNYATPMRPGTAVRTETNYYVDKTPYIGEITFVPTAGYQGTVTIPYSGVDTAGRSFSGTLKLILSDLYSKSSFSDMSGYEAVVPSVEFLRNCGVALGYENDTYGPGRSITRGEFTVMVYRAFELPDAGTRYSFSDVATDSYYAQAVAAAKAMGIVTGYSGRFMPSASITRQDAMTIVLRAMEATGCTLPNVSTSLLSVYTDGNRVSDYARAAVSTLAHIGAAESTQDGRIRPRESITRAEMAVLLHHVLAR